MRKKDDNVKKWMYVGVIIFIVIIAVLIGAYLFKKDNHEEKENSNLGSISNSLELQEEIKENTILNEISVSSIETEKISPNSVLILKKEYEGKSF